MKDKAQRQKDRTLEKENEMRQRRRKPMKCRTGKIRNAYEKMKDKRQKEE